MPAKTSSAGSTATSAGLAALLDHFLQPLHRLGRLALEALHVPAREREQRHWRLRHHGRVPRRALQHPHLAEELARAELRDGLAVLDHLGGPVLDDEEVVCVLALVRE